MTDSTVAFEELKELLLSRLINFNKRLERLEDENKPELRNRKNLSKASVVDCLSTSTAHGLPQLVQPQRLLWIPFVLLSTAACFLFIQQGIDQFNQYSFITMTEIKRLPSLTMPSVTICYRGNSTLGIQDLLVDCSFGKQKQNCSPMDFPMRNCVRLNFGNNQSLLAQDTEESYRSGLISV